jgi:hypothetical protein
MTTDTWTAAIPVCDGASVPDADFARFPGLVWENSRAD